jgi:hypothetical protein
VTRVYEVIGPTLEQAGVEHVFGVLGDGNGRVGVTSMTEGPGVANALIGLRTAVSGAEAVRRFDVYNELHPDAQGDAAPADHIFEPLQERARRGGRGAEGGVRLSHADGMSHAPER